jgi:hypothetical protein
VNHRDILCLGTRWMHVFPDQSTEPDQGIQELKWR